MNVETHISSTVKAGTETNIHKKPIDSVYAEVLMPHELKPFELERLYHIFSKYYDGHTKDQFLGDLSEKNHIILLRDKKDRSLQGFSTLLKVKVKTSSGTKYGIFSGDTILEKPYWGNPALGKAFLKYLWLEKIKNPFSPLYWFLISKGYKTYLLMANNFAFHFPRFEQVTPPGIQEIIDGFYGEKYGSEYLAAQNLIKPVNTNCRLKESIAEISPDDRKNPRIAFFEISNPNWKQGVELACIAEMTILMPLKYSLKKAFKIIRRKLF